jgi:hypothetical protein
MLIADAGTLVGMQALVVAAATYSSGCPEDDVGLDTTDGTETGNTDGHEDSQ